MKKQWLYNVGKSIESKVDCAGYAYTYRDHKVIGADWDDSDNTCTIFFNDKDAFVKYLDYIDDQVDYDYFEMEMSRWRCLNRKKY